MSRARPRSFSAGPIAGGIGAFGTPAPDCAAGLVTDELNPEYRCDKADMAAMPLPRCDLHSKDRAIAGVVQTGRAGLSSAASAT
ncbi:hypothetical protein [Rhodovulum sp. MB263]|uniref:hypothetical protein n=1 Tax=Rhodovulum sp. (strain MB263) TaxID=308754 RepID=UPI0009B7D67B|nr:hypothetical protein [Rhodovulum sp. MB263]ARC87519.1 hypothetical protein B5V46_02195 [Rhodovulum sp. MB263]